MRTTLQAIIAFFAMPLLLIMATLALLQAFPTREPLSQAIRVLWGALAYLSMATNLLLASRITFIESIFGGLDKAYKQHRQLGMLAMIAALLHFWSPPLFADKNCTGICAEVLNPSILAGQFALYTLLAFGLISAVRRYKIKGWQLPYGAWKLSHWLMLLVFITATYHLMTMSKMPPDYRNFAQVLGLVGMLSAIVYGIGQLLRFKRSHDYHVVSVEKQGTVTIIDAKTTAKHIQHKAGQFAFLHFKKAGLKEPHPFTISSGEGEQHIQFCIKAVGDFTTKVSEAVVVGDSMVIEGPYGRFGQRFAKKETWIAAGIGITPFLAMMKSRDSKNNTEKPEINLIHIARTENDFIQKRLLEALVQADCKVNFIAHDTSIDGRWSLSGNTKHIKYCGPKSLRSAISKQSTSVKFEEFQFN